MNPNPVNYISAADFQAYAYDVDVSQYNATTLSGILSQASRRVEAICHVTGLDLQTTTNERDRAAISAMGELFINVRRRPIAGWNTNNPAITAIRLVKGQFSVSLQLTNPVTSQGPQTPLYQISYPGNTVHYPSAYLAGTGTLMIGGSAQLMTLKGAEVFYEIDYTGGLQTIPDDVKAATALLARDLLVRRYNPMGAESFHQGSMSVSFGSSGETTMVSEARTLLHDGGYVRMSVF